MKKFLLSCLTLALSVSMFAANYTSKVTVTLYDGQYFPSLTIGESNDAEFAGGALVNGFYAPVQDLASAPLSAYAYYNAAEYENLVLDDFTNVPLGIKTSSATTYRFFFADLQGSISIYDVVEDKTIDCSSVYQFTIDDEDKNSVINDRFIIKYVPAPTCDYSREGLTVGKYYTICLPKAVANPEGASFWNMIHRNAEGTLAYLEEVQGGLEAGRPYIFQAEATSLCFEYSGDAEPAGAYGALVGTLAEMDQDALTAAGANIYLLNNNELWLVSGQSGNVLPANRAYVVYSELIPGNPQSAPGRRVRAIPMQTNGTTGFENIQASEAPAKPQGLKTTSIGAIDISMKFKLSMKDSTDITTKNSIID